MYVFDDLHVGSGSVTPEQIEKIRDFHWGTEHEFVRGGAYRNRSGELVTWDANESGSYVLVQTWPGE